MDDGTPGEVRPLSGQLFVTPGQRCEAGTCPLSHGRECGQHALEPTISPSKGAALPTVLYPQWFSAGDRIRTCMPLARGSRPRVYPVPPLLQGWGVTPHAPYRLRHSPSSTQRGCSLSEPRPLLLRLQLPQLRTENSVLGNPTAPAVRPSRDSPFLDRQDLSPRVPMGPGEERVPQLDTIQHLPGKNRLLYPLSYGSIDFYSVSLRQVLILQLPAYRAGTLPIGN